MLEQYFSNEFLRAFVVFVISLFILRLGLFIIERIAFFFTRKTKTDIDDKLLERSSKPLTFIAFLLSLIITIQEISLSANVEIVLLNLIYSILIIVFSYLLYVVIDLIIITGLKKLVSRTKSRVDDSILALIHSILRIALFVVALLYILSIWGLEIGPLLAGLGIAGLAVALALQPILSNIFSGAAIIMDNSVRIGDLVYLDKETRGKILKVGLRSTRIRTFDNELIIVPNTKLAESTIQNIALPEPKTRVVIPFGVAYGSDIEKVKKIILKEIKTLKNLTDESQTIVRFLEMADSSLNFKAYFYVNSFENRIGAIDEANTKIYNALNKNKIEIPFPQMDVHVKRTLNN